jgi:hypothetical protein
VLIHYQENVLSNEVERLRDHAADIVGQIIGPDESVYKFSKRNGFYKSNVRDQLSGNLNLKIDTLARYAEANGLRVRMTLEPIE